MYNIWENEYGTEYGWVVCAPRTSSCLIRPWLGNLQGKWSAPRCSAPPHKVGFLINRSLKIVFDSSPWHQLCITLVLSKRNQFVRQRKEESVIATITLAIIYIQEHHAKPGWLILPSIPDSTAKSAAVRAFLTATSVQPTFIVHKYIRIRMWGKVYEIDL